MVHKCCVYGCDNRAGKGSGVTFHSFPKDSERRRQWAVALRCQNGQGDFFLPAKNRRVCSVHFTEDTFDRTGQTTRLRDSAVPTIFAFPKHVKVTSEKRQSNNVKISNKKVQENTNVKRNVQPSPELSSGTAVQALYLNQQVASPLEAGNMMTLNRMVQEVRELYLGKTHPTSPFTCNAMSPRVILIRLTQKYIEKYTMLGLVKNEPLSEDEESWDSEWDRQEWDMNILEPLVEISDKPKNNSKKRKRMPNSGESRKRSRPPTVNQAKKGDNHVSELRESEFIDVSIKQEPPEPVPEPVSVPLEEISCSVPMATIPVSNTTAPSLPVYQVPTASLTVFVPQPQPLVLQHPVDYSVQNTSNLLINQQENRNNPSTSGKPNENIQCEMNLSPSIKQEEMENVFVVPFGGNIETGDKSAPEKEPSEPEIIECDSPEETTRKNRTAAIAASIGVAGASSNRKLRDLTFKLVELNNKNLQCDSRIEKIKDEFKKRLQVVEIEKKGIEQEIDKVLASIQDWKEARKQYA